MVREGFENNDDTSVQDTAETNSTVNIEAQIDSVMTAFLTAGNPVQELQKMSNSQNK